MLPEAFYLLFLLPPIALLTYFDVKRKGKIHLVWLAGIVLYYLGLAAFYGYTPYTPIWFAAFVGIGSLVFLYDLGWADRIFIAASVLAVPSIYILIIVSFAVLIYHMDRHANKLNPKLSILVPQDDPTKRPKFVFMPYLAIGCLMIGILAPAYGYLYWSQVNSISKQYNFTQGYNNYQLLICRSAYSLDLWPINQSFCPRIIANTVIIKSSNPAVGNCYYGLITDIKACNGKV